MNKPRPDADRTSTPTSSTASCPSTTSGSPATGASSRAGRGFEYDHGGFITQYPPGRYSRAHYHGAGAVLVCLRGAGYTFNWHRELGPTPGRTATVTR